MALRKEDFDDTHYQETEPMKRSRITIDISPALRRRIKMAAAQNEMSISDYVGGILEQAVPAETGTEQRERRPLTHQKLERILQVREEIIQHTGGHTFEDSTEIVRQMREERTRELEQL